MKRVLLVATMVVVLVSLMAGTALAGGWWTSGTAPWNEAGKVGDLSPATGSQTSPWNTAEAVGYGVDGDNYDRNPHMGFSTTSNNCKTCHAVHNGDSDGWRLLRGVGTVTDQVEDGFWSNGFTLNSTVDSSYSAGADYDAGDYAGFQTAVYSGGSAAGKARVGECDVCHLGTTALSYKRQYKLKAASVRAEHTLGATAIPDSEVTTVIDGYGESAGLQCYSCHTVHGGDRLGYLWGDNAWETKILRNDANRDGLAADGLGDYAVTGTEGWSTTLIAEAANQNKVDGTTYPFPAYPTSGSLTGANAGAARQANVVIGAASYTGVDLGKEPSGWMRSMICGDCHNKNFRNPLDTVSGANQTTHASWPTNPAYTMEVYGEDTTVAFTGGDARKLDDKKFGGCRACHRVSNQYSGPNAGPSIWPHQGVGYKFLTDAFTDQTDLPDGAGGFLTNTEGLDSVCLRCHNSAVDGSAGGTAGVSVSF